MTKISKQQTNVLNADINGKPIVISLFAGCGGSSLGYHYAGFKELLAIEWDTNAVETFKLNFPDVPVWQKDINKITGKEILEFLNIEKGKLDILDGSPPCQGFSTAGKRVVSDKRNDLVRQNIRIIDELQPKVFVIENVSGMIKGKMKGLFIEYMRLMKSLNYQVKCKLMNAKYYQVPQSRERVIFIGVRKDLGIEPSFPEGNKKVVTVKEAFKNLDNKQERIIPRGQLANIVIKMKAGETASKYHKKGNHFGTHKLHWNKVAPALIKTIAASINLIIHPEYNLGISINEAKRLHSFPDNFKFIGSYSEQWARIGNSVPPLFMKAIANHIKENILEKRRN